MKIDLLNITKLRTLSDAIVDTIRTKTGIDPTTDNRSPLTIIARTVWITELVRRGYTQTEVASVIGDLRSRPTVCNSVHRYQKWMDEPRFFRTEYWMASLLHDMLVTEIG